MAYFCLFRNGIRVGYPSARLLRTLPASQRDRVRGRAVLLLTANRYYALNGVRPGMLLRAIMHRLRGAHSYGVGRNTWYLVPRPASVGVLKVRRGIVEEVGIADPGLATGRSAMPFLTSFG